MIRPMLVWRRDAGTGVGVGEEMNSRVGSGVGSDGSTASGCDWRGSGGGPAVPRIGGGVYSASLENFDGEKDEGGSESAVSPRFFAASARYGFPPHHTARPSRK